MISLDITEVEITDILIRDVPEDVVAAVDGIERDDIAITADMYIKLHKKPEEPVTLDVIRAGKRLQMPLKTFRMGFRK